MRLLMLTTLSLFLFGCASITNDAYVPVALSFSDGSSGTCSISNKRMVLDVQIPSTPMIRRSDDALVLRCKTEDGRDATACWGGGRSSPTPANSVRPRPPPMRAEDRRRRGNDRSPTPRRHRRTCTWTRRPCVRPVISTLRR